MLPSTLISSIALIIFAYLAGSISSAVLVCRLMKLPDPRSEGSKNPGATNVLRLGGKVPAIMTLIGDVLKGVLPVVIARLVGLPEFVWALVALAAVIGHIFPLFFGFKGGKGVATALGAIIALSWQLGAISLLIWAMIAVVFRYSSLSSICMIMFMPVVAYFYLDKICLLPLVVMSLLILIKHKDNIQRLFRGVESKIGQKKSVV